MNDASQPLIPTRSRAKLPVGLSFPIGTELLSQHLAGVPQYTRLDVVYREDPILAWGSKRDGGIECRTAPTCDEQSFRRVLTVYFYDLRGPSACMKKHQTFEPAWSILVDPIPSAERHLVRSALIERGLPAMRDWLAISRPETWYSGNHNLRIAYAADPFRLCQLEVTDYRLTGCRSL